MGWVTWAAIYFTVWWTVLFAILPIGVQRAEDRAAGHDPGAPARPMMLKKVAITSVVSAILCLAGWAVFHFGLLDWRELMAPA
ncbi:DUF1467 family protein [Aerophototrophica crusticola]|uniref:DUF1467 family protein n=1 Tax=Aerophototrophica crusticola TaxID=1709002 RepID=A0A858R5T7_9PROT|nr:DUF1467 family protein [Rhodospirillaceae bacterium B3]